jgi:hypothetical protein
LPVEPDNGGRVGPVRSSAFGSRVFLGARPFGRGSPMFSLGAVSRGEKGARAVGRFWAARFHFGPEAHLEMKTSRLLLDGEVKWERAIWRPEWAGPSADIAAKFKGDPFTRHLAPPRWVN